MGYTDRKTDGQLEAERSDPMSRVPEETLIGVIKDVEEHYDCTYVLGDDPGLAGEIASELRSARKVIEKVSKYQKDQKVWHSWLGALEAHLAKFPEEE